jgi:hypothetical protein
MIQNGLYEEPKDHFEMWTGTVYVQQQYRKRTGRVIIPNDIMRHLQLNNKDKVVIAIKRVQE